MLHRIARAPAAWLALAAVIALLWGGRTALAAAPHQEPATDTAVLETPTVNLPAPLYYIDFYSGQIVRLGTDGIERRTITHEVSPVVAFDVAPDGSRLAYISGNRLIESDANGLNRIVKYDPGSAGSIDAPVYSPDGARIAFAYNGVNLIASGEAAGEDAVTRVLADDPTPPDGSSANDARSYAPQSWSPDGVHLLAEYRSVPSGGSFSILAPDSGVQVDIAPDESVGEPSGYAVRGDVAWKPDSTGFYIANSRFADETPGLSVVDAGNGLVTGLYTTTTDSPSVAAPVALVAGPHVTGDGALRAFVWELAGLPPGPASYALVAIDPVNGERTPVNDQVYDDIQSVLWAKDDSGAILLADVGYTAMGLTGVFAWGPVDGAPSMLTVYGSSPRWGSPDFGNASAEEAEVVALFEQALGLDAVRAGADSSTFMPSTAFAVQGADGVTYWVAHTTGMAAFAPEAVPHALAVYVREADGWREVSSLELGGTVDGVTAGPDYLNENGVMPVLIGAPGANAGDGTQLWLHVEGGAGAHSGVCEIVRLAGDILTSELDGFNPSPGACDVQDVNNDGVYEVVLNATDPYVFCYACGVRLINYAVQSWDGEQFVAVDLQQLPAAAPAELDSRNDELLRLVQGGLWKAALELVDSPILAGSPVLATTEPATTTELLTDTASITVASAITAAGSAATTLQPLSDPSGVWAWNKALVHLTGEARRQDAQDGAHPYPLLAQVFYGDYPAAVRFMQTYTVTEVFAQPSVLISGAVAAGWEGTLADWITTTTSAAIDVNGRLADAYFVRGWGRWLAGVTDATTGDLAPDAIPTTDVAIAPDELDAAVADVRRALDLFPEPFYAASLALLTGEEVALPAASDVATQILTATETVSPAATPAASGGGRIFYSTVQDGVDRIFTVEFGVQNATLNKVLEQARQPALQPDGLRLAYQSTRDDMLGVGAFDLDTGDRFNFTTNLEDSLPRWNPEGNRLVFSSTRYGDGRSRIYLSWAQAAEFATEEAIDLGEGSDPDWSLDGSRLVYKGCDETGANCGLWTMAIDGTDRQALTGNASDGRPRWTPDGSRAVFMSDGRDGNWDVYSVLVATGEVTRISFNAASDGLPAVSPDGSEIVFVSNRGNQWGIWRVPIDSGRAESVVGDLGALTNWLDHSLDWVR